MAHFNDNEGSISPNRIALGKWRARKVTIASGAGALLAGTVLGKIDASGKYLKSLSAATDGSEVVDAILSEDVDATSADKEAVVYIAGEFDQDKLILGTGHTLGSIDATCRDKSIWLIKCMG